MSDLESSLNSSSSEDDGENIDDSSDSDSSSSSSSGSGQEDSPKNDNKSWVLSRNSPEHGSSVANHFEQENDADDKSGDDNFDTKPLRRGPKEDLRLLWESNPQIYGVRRSSRPRKEPERLKVLQESDESGSNRRRGAKRSRHEDYTGTLTDTESDSDSEFGSLTAVKSSRTSKLLQMRARRQGKKRGGGRKLKRQKYDSDETSSDEDGKPKRSSTRTQNTKISYKESSQDETDSDDVVEIAEKEEEVDNSECIDKVMDDRLGKSDAVGSVTTWYAVNANGDPNETFDPESSDGIQQYLIAWKGWSHIHNTWESEKSLKEQKVRGMKKLENYIKKKDEVDAWLKVASPEDAEYFLCQQELGRDLVTTYKKVDRVIAKSRQKNRSGFWDYRVKWKGLPYGECTWEDGKLINHYFSKDVEKFEQRQENAKVPKKDAKKHLPSKFVPLKSSPHWLQGNKGYSLRDYQVDGVNWLANSWFRNNSVILADEMGLGKTIQSITFFSYLYHFHDVYGPFLIIVPLSTITSWQHEFQTWAAFMNVIMYVGDARSRSLIRDVEWEFPNKKLKFNVVLTTYEILLKEKLFLGSHTWAVIAVDEAHRLKNEDSLLYKSLIEFKSHHRLLITGTPLQNSLKELWSLLHFIMPEKFGSWFEFEECHGGERETGYTSLHKILQPFLLRRVKKDVEKSLPAKVERILRVEMSSIQKQYYRWILTKNYQELLKGNKGRVSSFCNIVMELKKCCNHAFLTKIEGRVPANNEERLQNLIRSSGKMILLDKLLKRLREGGHRVLIFSQMVRMLDLLQEYLIMNRIGFQRLDGSIKGEIRRQALDRFNAPGSEDFCFLLSTRAGGLGINLASADTVIIFDSDWNPQNDLQAQARAHRIGQTNQVNIYRLVCVGSVEEDIIERAKRKMVLDHLVIQRMDTSGKTVLSKNNAPSATTGNPFNKEELSAILKFGAEDLFKETEGDEIEPECDIDEILRRAETTEEQTESGSELLSAFKFATFTFDEDEDTMQSSVKNGEEDSRSGQKDWDDIIPEADRKKIEEEQRKKQEAELYLPPRNRKSLKVGAGASGSDAGSDESDDSDEEEEENDVSSKKRGRARRGQTDAFPGFTTQEVRKFVKSFRKFGNPLDRLDAIARDAELTIQSEADLKRLGQQLHTQLTETMQDFNKKLNGANGENPPSQASKRGPSFRIGGASVSVKTTMACINDLKPLVDVMPKNAGERERFCLTIPVKPIRGWDCEWTSEDDSKLLIGIYEYGMGSWDQLQSDTLLGLEKKILRPNNEKPQAKQLQTRVEYLMKLLRKTQEIGRMPTGVITNTALLAAASKVARNVRQGNKDKSPDKHDDSVSHTKKRSRKIKSKARVEVADESDVADNVTNNEPAKKSRKIQKKRKITKDKNMNNIVKEDGKVNKKKSRKIKRKQKLKKASAENHIVEKKKHDGARKSHKKVSGPVHISAASDPVPIGEDEFSGELNKEVFFDCKERMRPVKKALKLLDKPPPNGSTGEKAQHEHMKNCVLKIGDRVNQCLCEFKDSESRKSWRRNLWIFVSQFTEYSAHELYKIFAKACRKREDSKRKVKKKNSTINDGLKPDSKTFTKSSKTNSTDKPVKVSHGKRSHSPLRNAGAGDGPNVAVKRSFNHRDRPPSHIHHPRNAESGYNDRRTEGAPYDQQPHPKHHRSEGPGYQRDWDARRFGNEPQRFSHGPPHYQGWSRREDGMRYPNDDFRMRDYENSRRYPRDYPHGMPPRDESRYSGHHRSPYSEHGPPSHHDHHDSRRYQSKSRRSNSPFQRGKSPIQPITEYAATIHSPSSSRGRAHLPATRTEQGDLMKRETVT